MLIPATRRIQWIPVTKVSCFSSVSFFLVLIVFIQDPSWPICETNFPMKYKHTDDNQGEGQQRYRPHRYGPEVVQGDFYCLRHFLHNNKALLRRFGKMASGPAISRGVLIVSSRTRAKCLSPSHRVLRQASTCFGWK